MPVLPNNRWENFANNLVRGMTQFKAYEQAGFTKNSRAAKALAANEKIVARVAELRALAVAETTLSAQKVLSELEKIGFANMLDYIKIDDDGNANMDFSRLTREQAAAIGEITTEETTNPRTGEVTKRTKFKLLDKKGALIDLGKWLKMWVDRKEVAHAGIVFHVTESDMQL